MCHASDLLTSGHHSRFRMERRSSAMKSTRDTIATAVDCICRGTHKLLSLLSGVAGSLLHCPCTHFVHLSPSAFPGPAHPAARKNTLTSPRQVRCAAQNAL